MAMPNPAAAVDRPEIDAAEFQSVTGVSHETLERLQLYDARLRQWQKRINLVSRGTLTDAWRRHFLDSAQLFSVATAEERAGPWLDIGSGAGFPGLVLAIMGGAHVHLVESDKRKAAFLREVARTTQAPVTIHAARIESMTPFPVDAVTGRAIAPMSRLLEMAAPYWGAHTTGLFLKGRDIETELTDVAKYWKMETELLASRTSDDGRIVRIKNLQRHIPSGTSTM